MTKHPVVSSQLSHKTNPGCSYCGPLAFFFHLNVPVLFCYLVFIAISIQREVTKHKGLC